MRIAPAVSWVAAVCLATALAPAEASAQAGDGSGAESRSTLDGVYTGAQAERGQETFQESCTACHAPGYFTASAFRRSWSGRAVYFLFNTIRTTMPEDSPGSLRPRQVADVLAYMLQLNGYPEGPEPLPEDGDALRLIVWEAR